MRLTKPSEYDWAEAIANLITDEWDGTKSFPNDAELIKNTLIKTLIDNPQLISSLIGTGVIEEDYFEVLY